MKNIQVKLIDYTGFGTEYPEKIAAKKLIYTKSTRLGFGIDTMNKINKMSNDELEDELKYIANTIPSSWEFLDYTFEILNVTRGFTHQFVRTRQGSYAQQTMRMLEMKDFSYMIPEKIKDDFAACEIYKNGMRSIQNHYDDLIEMDIPVEDARGVLPTNIHTNIIAKFNLRTLSEMAKSRTGGRTQGEYIDVFNQICDRVISIHPFTKLFLFPGGNREEWEIVDKAIKGNVAAQKAFDKIKKAL